MSDTIRTIRESVSPRANTPQHIIARSLRCVSLGTREEHRAGCGGWNCLHACTSTDPAAIAHLGGVMTSAPGGDCQTCDGYVARA